MDREQDDMQYLGLFGIYKESTKIIFKWKKIFSQITLIFILPLSFIFLARIKALQIFLGSIWQNQMFLEEEIQTQRSGSYWATYLLFNAAYFTVLLIFGLLSTSAVVYTIACIYTDQEIAFKKIMSVVPKVWKRVIVTFFCTFLAFFLYNVVAVLAVVLWAFLALHSVDAIGSAGAVIGIIMLILYIIGFIYMCIIWQLANVVSVLEETRGFKAMIKSKKLLKGKMWPATFILFKLLLFAIAIEISFQLIVAYGVAFNVMGRVAFGILCLLLLLMLILFGLVLQTVLYFVCKSYHNENIDKSAMRDHLEVIYLGDHDPMSVQLQQV